MKNSSRLLAEIDRKRSRSSSGCEVLQASSRTRRLNASQLSARSQYLHAAPRQREGARGADPRERRVRGVAGFLEDPAIECEPAQLPIEIPRWSLASRRIFHS